MLLNKIHGFIHSKKEGMNFMKTTGITRRIDELGRVVIPKEIRKNMNIKKGELLEIYLQDEAILLKKYNMINKKQNFLKEYIIFLSSVINCDIYVTNMDEIVFSNVENSLNQKISKDLEGYMKNKNMTDIFYISKHIKIYNPYYIFPLNPNGDLIGYVIFNFHEENMKINKSLIDFSLAFIKNYLETD